MSKSNPASDIRIDGDGVWFYRGAEMTRREIVSLFYKHLLRDAEGGYFIEIGRQKYPVEVEDTAYVVQEVRWIEAGDDTEESARLILSDGTIEELDPGTLRIEHGDIPYCRVRNGSFKARFSRSSYYRLAQHIEHDASRDAFFISLKGRLYYL